MYLLNRLYEADEGEILIGGYDINDLTSEELKGKINFAIQKNFIFHDTVYNNIVLGDELITKSDVYKACEATGLSSEFNDEFNLDTLIFENASNLSNILQKKIMLTRSIVRDKDIYIFDEYDYRVENKTNIILTKNIEQIKDIDHIIVFR
ncbi:MAG: ABC transporter ATP-binding protein/permease [Methanobrevibacter sp.]|nr:ABC transporter ATP-binding protein/permease [Methanobrevibacter sp.]